MKKAVVRAFVKDMIVVALFIAIASMEGTTSQEVFLLLPIFGVFYGWSFASKIITAVSMRGIATKAAISALFGSFIFPFTVIRDTIYFAKYMIQQVKHKNDRSHKQHFVEGEHSNRHAQ